MSALSVHFAKWIHALEQVTDSHLAKCPHLIFINGTWPSGAHRHSAKWYPGLLLGPKLPHFALCKVLWTVQLNSYLLKLIWGAQQVSFIMFIESEGNGHLAIKLLHANALIPFPYPCYHGTNGIQISSLFGIPCFNRSGDGHHASIIVQWLLLGQTSPKEGMLTMVNKPSRVKWCSEKRAWGVLGRLKRHVIYTVM